MLRLSTIAELWNARVGECGGLVPEPRRVLLARALELTVWENVQRRVADQDPFHRTGMRPLIARAIRELRKALGEEPGGVGDAWRGEGAT